MVATMTHLAPQGVSDLFSQKFQSDSLLPMFWETFLWLVVLPTLGSLGVGYALIRISAWIARGFRQ